MESRAEVTSRCARSYLKAAKKEKGRILDQVVEVTGWSRDNARRRLVAAAKRSPGLGREVAKRPRKPRSPRFSYDAVKVLQRVWAASARAVREVPPQPPSDASWSPSRPGSPPRHDGSRIRRRPGPGRPPGSACSPTPADRQRPRRSDHPAEEIAATRTRRGTP